MTEAGRREVGEGVVVAVAGDLTQQDVDAVVNAANEHLSHGGGVAKALAKAGGPAVTEESEQWVATNGEVGPGQAAVTTAGQMPATHLVHVVGPRYRDDQDNEALLRQAVRAALDAARDAGAASVALPAISAGIFGYPPEEAGTVIAAEAVDWLGDRPGGVREVRLVGLDEEAAGHFAAAL
jgi:O-acetyl-ADP-ribose deacetylase